MTEALSFTVNGREVAVEAEGDITLLTVLREHLGLKATRYGCGAEICGACTVVVDGEARYSCTLPAAAVDGSAIITAEGLVGPAGDHPLLAAFLDRQAGQCGYCLPGILMRARALLDRGGPIDRTDVARELDANLCRCGAHGRILVAIMDAAHRMGLSA